LAAEGAGTHGPMYQFEIKKIFDLQLGNYDVSFTNASLMMVIALAVISGFMVFAMRGRSLVPTRIQSVAEMLYEFIANMVRENLGKDGMTYFPWVFSIFIFILVLNLLGMIPGSFTVTSHIIVTFAIAAMVWLVATGIGFAKHGLGYLKLFVPEGVPLLLMPVIVPIVIGLACGLFAGLINGLLVAYTKIPPFIATLGMMVSARGAARWWSNGQPVSFPTAEYGTLANGDILGGMTFGLLSWPGQNPAVVFVVLALLFHVIMTYTLYGKRSYAIGSNEAAARMSGINVDRHKVLVYAIAGLLAAVAAVLLTSKNLTAQAGMGVMYELDAIAMAVIGGVSLAGGRGSILGTVLGAAIFSVIISGFTSIKLDAYYQEMVKGAIIVGAVVLDQWRQRRRIRG